ncbi:MAG: MarR family transcriptional regulator [Candidatus Omnitrophica bacterium]|nr:MarR family transcriptional regulator [Candidatus Omnitrophota bacterium]MDD5573832.1 MarR family transcriptional regulator [Candidatus Omnitrophota bacterium]
MTQKNLREFTRELTQLMPLIIRGILKRQPDEISSGKITMPQCLVLDMLKNKGAMKMTEIASDLGTSLPAATGLIDRLHGLKMLSRMYDKNDRRVIRIQMTPRGQRLVARLRSEREKTVNHIFGKLSGEERQTYLKILRKVHDAIYEKL